MILFEIKIAGELERVSLDDHCRVTAGSDGARLLFRDIIEMGGWLPQHGPIERYYALTAIARYGGRVIEFGNESNPNVVY